MAGITVQHDTEKECRCAERERELGMGAYGWRGANRGYDLYLSLKSHSCLSLARL